MKIFSVLLNISRKTKIEISSSELIHMKARDCLKYFVNLKEFDLTGRALSFTTSF